MGLRRRRRESRCRFRGGATLTSAEIVAHPEAKRFRLCDDDGNVYYEGSLVGGDEFAPMDDFGEPNAGATTTQIFENGKWEVL